MLSSRTHFHSVNQGLSTSERYTHSPVSVSERGRAAGARQSCSRKSADCDADGCCRYRDKTAGILSLIRGFRKWSLFSPHLINELWWCEKPGALHVWKAQNVTEIFLSQLTPPTLIVREMQLSLFLSTTMMSSHLTELT